MNLYDDLGIANQGILLPPSYSKHIDDDPPTKPPKSTTIITKTCPQPKPVQTFPHQLNGIFHQANIKTTRKPLDQAQNIQAGEPLFPNIKPIFSTGNDNSKSTPRTAEPPKIWSLGSKQPIPTSITSASTTNGQPQQAFKP
ncbi:hypothetical protein CAPTEDRAFT_213557, partial [Capitella teleta]